MDDRGVTRPLAQDFSEQKSRLQKLNKHHKNTLWIYWSLICLGLWLLASPFTFGYLNQELWVDPSGGRGAWWSDQTHTNLRAWLMFWSDIISGAVLVFFGLRSLRPNRPVSLWICCLVGMWITMAPVFFWAPTAASYYNDTIVGALVIALTILIPGMPNMIMYMKMGGDTPEGWSYNPSSWPQRWIMIVLGFAGWIVSRYLATFQLGYTDYVWDPFFGFEQGSQKVLNSSMSHAWPISDAGLGALSYTFEFLMGWMGASSRWRTMPWMVTLFGILVIPLGITHIFLVISMPVLVGAWCAFCLLAAAIMLPMIPLEVDEVFAMIQHMKEAKKRGDRGGSLWKVFWKGGEAGDAEIDKRSPEMLSFPERPGAVVKSSLWGFSSPWTLSACAVLGMGIMFLPSLFETPKTTSNIFHLGGALVITFSVIAMGEIIRSLRFLNLPLAAIIGVGPFFIESLSGAGLYVAAILSALIAFLSLPRGVVKESFGPWDKYIK